MPSKRQLTTVCVVLLLLVAGCSGFQAGDSSNPESDGNQDDTANITTYVNDSGTSTFTMEVNHDTESYNMTFENTFSPPYSEFERDSAIRIYCNALNESVYNYTGPSENQTTYTRFTATGESETVEGIPEYIMRDYEPNDVSATTYAENGSVLASCTVNGEGDISYNN